MTILCRFTAETDAEGDAARRLASVTRLIAEIAEPDDVKVDPEATDLPGDLLHALATWRPVAASHA